MCDCDKCNCKNIDDCVTDGYCDCCDHAEIIAPD